MNAINAQPQTPALIDTLSGLRARVRDWRGNGERIALVPTMGALHDGHLTLVRAAAAQAERVIVSIFVNPTQFAPHEDFDRYPRNLDGDLNLLAGTGAHAVYAPDRATMYPPGHQTRVTPGGIAEPMEGAFRPGFFTGVATIVTKLFNQVAPDLALFGEKDYQQLMVIRQMVRDLDLPIQIIGCPIARAGDGLALSSRNAYLSEAERKAAPTLHAVLADLASALTGGADYADLQRSALTRLTDAGFETPDYLDFRDAATLEPLARADKPGRLLVAARLGTTRLIDNVAVAPAA